MTYASATQPRYTLPKRGKHTCPGCHKKTFVRYVDTATGDHIPEQYGRCDRQENCGYYLNPYKDGWAKTQKTPVGWVPPPPKPKAPLVFIPKSILQATIDNGYDKNVFIQNLLTRVPFPFDQADVMDVAALYKLGTVINGYRAGSVTFPFIDERDNIRTIQTTLFDKTNHRVKTDFLHAIIENHYKGKGVDCPDWLKGYLNNDGVVSCLFGAHLLSLFPHNRIALVEAPKTAIYGTLYFGLPKKDSDLLWLAVYSKDTLNVNRCKCLAGRTVYLFPDLSKDGKTFDQWKTTAGDINSKVAGIKIIVSDILEKLATDEQRAQGEDIADFLIRLDWRSFRKG
jgi:hypothetical protein